MLGIDTNILVRFIVGDDPRQLALAADILEKRCTAEAPGFITVIVMVELFWTMRLTYGYGRRDIARTIYGLLRAKELTFEHPDAVRSAYQAFAADNNSDFADALLGAVAQAGGCSTTLTFDKAAARLPEFTYAGE